MSDYQALVNVHKVIQRGETDELAALLVTDSAIRRNNLGKTASLIFRDRG